MPTPAPRAARASAIARPIPREPPVTTATRPVSAYESGRMLLMIQAGAETAQGRVSDADLPGQCQTPPLPLARHAHHDAVIGAAAGHAVHDEQLTRGWLDGAAHAERDGGIRCDEAAGADDLAAPHAEETGDESGRAGRT